MFSSMEFIFVGKKSLSRAIFDDDQTANGAGEFLVGIRFGSSEFPNWQSVRSELL